MLPFVGMNLISEKYLQLNLNIYTLHEGGTL
jgi:hypothetical protein